MNRLTDVFGDSAIVAEDVRKTAYELEDKHNIASYPLLEAADHIESLYAEAVKMQAEIETIKDQRDVLLMALNATLIELTYTANQLEQLTDLKKGSAIIEAIEQAKAAIAKARGESV